MENYHCSTIEPAQIKPAILDITATLKPISMASEGEKVTLPLGRKASHR